MHAAVAALRASGEAGAALARVLDEPYAFHKYYPAALSSTRLPDHAFDPEAGPHLESAASLQAWRLLRVRIRIEVRVRATARARPTPTPNPNPNPSKP